MRGALLRDGGRDDGAGIIPAYAGSTLTVTRGTRWTGDHPRICGEHHLFVLLAQHREGSSPHMRGAPTEALKPDTISGIIPAYAGSTIPSTVHITLPGDHPRICGEHGND